MKQIKKVTERHIEAYNLWKKCQNLRKVAQEMGVRYDTIASWSSFFEWRKKLAEEIASGDNGITSTVTSFRKNAILISDLIQGWTLKLAQLYDKVIREKRDFTDEEEAQKDRYLSAIRTFDPKAMQNLLGYIKGSYSFHSSEEGGGDTTFGRRDRINFTGPTLVMFGPADKNGNKEQIMSVEGIGVKGKLRLSGSPTEENRTEENRIEENRTEENQKNNNLKGDMNSEQSLHDLL